MIDAFKSKKKGKGQHEAHLANAGTEDPQSLVAPVGSEHWSLTDLDLTVKGEKDG